ncbi:UNVERIFIED_CONTAM: hypothetical protein GTU68_049572 [Idotea baltica]|nr:hypothetical protein [Idotea baltica]
MADEQVGTTQGEQADKNNPQFAIDRIYVKDISLETPKGLSAFNNKWKPRVDLDINTSQSKVADDRHEVTLRLTVTVKDQESDEVYYLIEIKQSGLFLAKGFPEQELPRLLASAAPATLFPYARETIDSLVTRAGFPPLRLAPINFDALWQAAVKKQQQSAQGTVQ